MKYKNVKVIENARFIICIDDKFDGVTLRDLSGTLNNVECHRILQENFNDVVKLVKVIERKSDEKINNEQKVFKHLKVIK